MKRAVLCFAAFVSAAACLMGTVVIRDQGETSNEQKNGLTARSRRLEINTGRDKCELWYNYQQGKDGKIVPFQPPYSGVGLGPNTANWYKKGHGFFSMVLNGKHVLSENIADLQVKGDGAKGVVQLKWRHELADVTLTIVALDNDAKLLAEAVLEPKQEVKSLQLLFLCYPHYTSNPRDEKAGLERWIATVGRSLKPSPAVLLEPGEDWIFYYDTKIKMNGPCALMIGGAEKDKIKVAGDSGITTTVDCLPETRKIRFALWDFGGIIPEWKDALEQMKNTAMQSRQDLERETFAPLKIKIIEGD